MVARNLDRPGILLRGGALELLAKLRTVLAELKRRKVYGVAALYAAPGDSSAGTITGQGPLPSIAVVDMSPDEYQEYFCAGTGVSA